MFASHLVALSLLATTWTVDDSGGAQFTEISHAIAIAAPGDVILVEPGDYAAILVDQSLTILGRSGAPRPSVHGTSRALNAPALTVGHLAFERFLMQDVIGRAQVDDCFVGASDPPLDNPPFRVKDCADVVVTRSEVRANKASSYADIPDAARVRNSRVAFTDCRIEAGQGYCPTIDEYSNGWIGGAALTLFQDSYVVLAGCSEIVGGEAGFGSVPFSPTDGYAGPGIRLESSTLVLRGEPTDIVRSGYAEPMYHGVPSDAIIVTDSTVSHSGVLVFGPLANPFKLTNSTLVQPATPEPFLEVIGDESPGAAQIITTYHAPGAVGLLLISFSPGRFDLPELDTPLWMNPSSMVILPFANPLALPVMTPASTVSFEGLTLHVQAAFPGLPGTLDPNAVTATNPAAIVAGF